MSFPPMYLIWQILESPVVHGDTKLRNKTLRLLMTVVDWHTTSYTKLPLNCMPVILSQSRQSCHSRSEQHGQVRGELFSHAPHMSDYYAPARTVHHHLPL